MFKKLSGSIIALSIAFTGLSAAPASANHDLTRFLLGVGAVALIASEVNKNKSKAAPAPVYSNKRKPPKQAHTGNGNRGKKCLRQRWTQNGWITYRDKNCSQKNKPKPVSKPKVCLRKKWTASGWEKYYSRRCLREHGYRL